jgi:hypothetical protein
MLRLPSIIGVALGAALAAACSHAPPTTQAAPRAAAAPGQNFLVGDWAVQLIIQGQTTSGSLQVTKSGDRWGGVMQLDTTSQLYYVRTAQTQGRHFILTIGAPDGDVRVEGNLRTPTQLDAIWVGQHTQGHFIADRR